MGYPTRQAGQPGGLAAAAIKNVRRHARDRLLLPCPYSTPLGMFRFPGPAPLGLAGGAMDVVRLKVEVRGDRRLGLIGRPGRADHLSLGSGQGWPGGRHILIHQ